MSQVKANPTKSTLDAVKHEKDLEEQRAKRANSSIIIPNQQSVDGQKKEYSVSDVSEDGEDYSIKEGQRRTKVGTNNSGTEASPLN